MQIKKEIKKDAYAIKILIVESGKEIARAWLYVLFNSLHKEPFAFLEDGVVEEGYRGQGHGSALAKLAAEEAKNQGCYKLIFTARNIKPEGQKLYLKLGFKDWGKEFRMDLI